MKKIILGILMIKSMLMADFQTIDIKTFEKLKSEGVPVIDIRTPDEWTETGVIEGTHKITFFDDFGEAHLAEWCFKVGHIVKNEKAPLIIYCASGRRTHKVGEILSKLGFENVYELKGGISKGWIDLGKKTEPSPEVF